MYKIGLSSCGKVLNEQLFADYASSGIEAMEISPHWAEYKSLNYKQLQTYAKTYGITLWSYHLPFQTTEISTEDRAWRLCALEYMSELIKQASDIGIHKFVAHASSETTRDPEKRAERMAYAKDSLNQLAEIAAKFDSEICVEDLPRGCLGNCSDEILDLLSANDKLRVCFDTNHLLGEDIVAFIKRVGDKITTLHVSDYDYVDERHWLPGEGGIPWDKVYNALQEVGYSGVWMYEISFRKNLGCKEFANNAKEIFAGKPLTVLSK